MSRHEEKLGNSLLGAWLYDPTSEGDPPDKVAFHRQRLAATYVDFRENVVQSPVDNVDAPTLEQAFTSIGRQLAVSESMTTERTVEEFAAMMEAASERTSWRASEDEETQIHNLIRLACEVGLRHWDPIPGTQ